jgi:hypothetical protein
MEWVSIKPLYKDGTTALSATQHIFSMLTRAGFQLEQQRRNIAPDTEEYFYFHPGQRIQVHEVRDNKQGALQFFIFYADGSTAYAADLPGLESLLIKPGRGNFPRTR